MMLHTMVTANVIVHMQLNCFRESSIVMNKQLMTFATFNLLTRKRRVLLQNTTRKLLEQLDESIDVLGSRSKVVVRFYLQKTYIVGSAVVVSRVVQSQVCCLRYIYSTCTSVELTARRCKHEIELADCDFMVFLTQNEASLVERESVCCVVVLQPPAVSTNV